MVMNKLIDMIFLKTIKHNILEVVVLILVVCLIIEINTDFFSSKIISTYGFLFVILLGTIIRKIKTKR